MRRLQVVLGHLTGHPQCRGEPAPEAAPCLSGASQVSAEDVVVVHGRRTAIGRGGRGGFKVRPRGPGAQWKTGGLRGWGLAPRRRRGLRSRAVTALCLSGGVEERGSREPRALVAGDHRGGASRCRTPPPMSFSRPS